MVSRKPQERFIRANSIHIRYLDWNGDDPPILLLHNNRGTADPWRRYVDVSPLTNRYIAPDQRGCGSTEKPPTGYSAWHLAADVAGLVDTLKLGRVPIVGCAIGGSIGLAVAANYPEKVSALAILDSGFPIEQPIIDRSVATLKAMPYEFESKEAAKAFVRTLPDSLGYSWSLVWEDYFEWTFRELEDGRWVFMFDKDAMIQATSHLSDDLWEDAAKIECPVLVTVAGQSEIISDEGGRELTDVIPNARYELLEGVGHLVFLETDLEPIEKLVREFLQEAGALI
jgi:pimeloyl-ACP methyl ester carboxylesterase